MFLWISRAASSEDSPSWFIYKPRWQQFRYLHLHTSCCYSRFKNSQTMWAVQSGFVNLNFEKITDFTLLCAAEYSEISLLNRYMIGNGLKIMIKDSKITLSSLFEQCVLIGE